MPNLKKSIEEKIDQGVEEAAKDAFEAALKTRPISTSGEINIELMGIEFGKKFAEKFANDFSESLQGIIFDVAFATIVSTQISDSPVNELLKSYTKDSTLSVNNGRVSLTGPDGQILLSGDAEVFDLNQ